MLCNTLICYRALFSSGTAYRASTPMPGCRTRTRGGNGESQRWRAEVVNSPRTGGRNTRLTRIPEYTPFYAYPSVVFDQPIDPSATTKGQFIGSSLL